MITTDRGGQALPRHPGIHRIIGPRLGEQMIRRSTGEEALRT